MANQLNINDIINKLKNTVGSEYTFIRLQKEQGKPNKMILLHNKCNKEYIVEPNKFFNKGNRCNCIIRNIEDFNNEMIFKKGNNYSLTKNSSFNGMKKPIEVKHNVCGKTFKPTPYEFLRRNRNGKIGCECSNCFRYGKSLKKTNEEFIDEIKNITEDEYLFIDDYKTSSTKICVKHNVCGKTYKVKPNDFLNGHRCPYCSRKNISIREKSFVKFIKKIYEGNIITSDRTVLSCGKELDIYLPDLKIAFEYDGLYWHSDMRLKNPKNYHLNKTNECKEKGIRLIHIFDDEWINKQKLVKNKIRYILKCTNNKKHIYARKCWIKEIDSKTKNIFLNKYHIQGEDKASIKLGLYTKSPKTNKDLLVSVMTFCKPRKSLGQSKNSKYDYELSRFASNGNYIIVGSFSKLFKYFEKNYDWNKLITYADIRWSEGNVYLKNGWLFNHNSVPNYWYTKGHIREHRFKYRPQNLKNLFEDYNGETEREFMKKKKFYRIYDCGNMVFEYVRR